MDCFTIGLESRFRQQRIRYEITLIFVPFLLFIRETVLGKHNFSTKILPTLVQRSCLGWCGMISISLVNNCQNRCGLATYCKTRSQCCQLLPDSQMYYILYSLTYNLSEPCSFHLLSKTLHLVLSGDDVWRFRKAFEPLHTLYIICYSE